jgi:uncharacterized Zn-finger protein
MGFKKIVKIPFQFLTFTWHHASLTMSILLYKRVNFDLYQYAARSWGMETVTVPEVMPKEEPVEVTRPLPPPGNVHPHVYLIFISWDGRTVRISYASHKWSYCKAPMMNEMEPSMISDVVGQTEVFGQNLPTYLFVHQMTWDRTWSVAVRSRRLTCPMSQPHGTFVIFFPEPTTRGQQTSVVYIVY